MSEVYVNGKYIGTVDSASDFVQKFKDERRRNIIDSNVNIYHNEQTDEVFIQTERGRARRPLVVVKDGVAMLTEQHVKQVQKGELTWSDLVEQGIIEYLDAGEEENALVAYAEKDLTYEHTHLEISPFGMLGLACALVPFGNYNQSTRLNAGTKNQKQAISFYASNFALRLDMDVNILHYPQMPIVQTIMHDISDYQSHPGGQNLIVAVLSYKGYNMEDATLINKGSIDRGLGRSSYFRPAVAEELRYSGV